MCVYATKNDVPIVLQLAYLHQFSTNMEAVVRVKDNTNPLHVNGKVNREQKNEYAGEQNSKQQDNTIVVKRSLGLISKPDAEEDNTETDGSGSGQETDGSGSGQGT